MSKYRDTDEVLEQIRKKLGIKSLDYLLEAERQIVDAIQSAPSIDIVRCKDCKYWHDHITTTWCSRGAELRPQESGWIKRNPDDYCSYGDRKEHE